MSGPSYFPHACPKGEKGKTLTYSYGVGRKVAENTVNRDIVCDACGMVIGEESVRTDMGGKRGRREQD